MDVGHNPYFAVRELFPVTDAFDLGFRDWLQLGAVTERRVVCSLNFDHGFAASLTGGMSPETVVTLLTL
jgi:hypothetical protein